MSIQENIEDAKLLNDSNFLKELYKQLFSNSSDPLFICDVNYRLVESNKAFDELFHGTDSLDRRSMLSELFESKNSLDDLSAEVSDRGIVDDREVRLLNHSGDRVYALLSLISIYNNEGQTLGYQGIIHDETQRLLNKRKLTRAQKMVFTGRMVRTIAHEIRNPLTNVSLAISNLREGEPSEDDMLMLDIIEKNGNRINELITELLDSSRPAELALQGISLQSLIMESLELARDRMQLLQIELLCHFDSEPIHIQVDIPKLKLAFNNLYINAIEAMDAGGELHVTIKQDEKHAWIQISDTGPGMSEEVLDHLFDPYFTTKSNGTGLGLTSVQNIFESHGWSIDVESTLGKGSTFIIAMTK